VPNNAFMLSTHNGFKNYNHTKYEISYLQFPSQINLLNIHYNNFNLSILDYGFFEDKIDNFTNNTFNSFEGLVNYNFEKNIFNQFSLYKSITSIISKIEHYTSIALMGNVKLQANIPTSKIKLGFSINNFGFILKEYTNYNQNLPINTQFYIKKKLNQNINLGYNFDYYLNTKHIKHIFLITLKINQLIDLRISNTNYSKNLYYNNYLINGLAMGLSIKASSAIYDISISNLGSAGYIYGMTVKF